MKTYRIDGVYQHGYEEWLTIGCPEDEVGRHIEDYLEEITPNGEKRFKRIIVTIED